MKPLTLFLFSLASLLGQTSTGTIKSPTFVGPPVLTWSPLPDVYVWNGPGVATDTATDPALVSLNIMTNGGRAVITPDGSITYLDGATPESVIKALIKIVQEQSERIDKLSQGLSKKEVKK